jgi:monofunctional biosynthetic peptidoglycan transglycosylase
MWKKWTRRAATVLAAAFLLNISFYMVYPDVSRLKRERPAKTAFMAYRERQWEQAGRHNHIRQVWAPLAGISPHVVKAVIIAEDDKFWSHEGFDFEAIQKAIEKDLETRRFKAGGSTISQQLAKNLYLTPAKNPVRKLKEAILTWRLERNLSKRRIIELYLNVAEWGDGIFGIEAAARHYFGKGAGALTAREAAALAVVLPSPLRYNPTGGGRYVESRSDRRRCSRRATPQTRASRELRAAERRAGKRRRRPRSARREKRRSRPPADVMQQGSSCSYVLLK